MMLDKFVYESHLEGLYTFDDYEDDCLEICEQCGDSDKCIGYFETKEELREWMKNNNYNDEYIGEFLEEVE